MSSPADKPTREEVEARITKLRAKHQKRAKHQDCEDLRYLSPDADVYEWFRPDGTCTNIDSGSQVSIVFACSNDGYFSFDVQYKLEAKHDVVGFAPPTEGSFLVPAPKPNEDYGFNWDFSIVTPKINSRKDDCSIMWSADRGGAVHSAMTLVNITTM